MQLGRWVTRTVVGSPFVGHGAQKLFGPRWAMTALAAAAAASALVVSMGQRFSPATPNA